MKLVLATHNQGKVQELRAILEPVMVLNLPAMTDPNQLKMAPALLKML